MDETAWGSTGMHTREGVPDGADSDCVLPDS